jgi:hypothetical protein
MMLKKLLPFLAVGCMLTCILVACGAGGASANTAGSPNASGTEVHMNSANFVQTGTP